jgi:hypothetical protein
MNPDQPDVVSASPRLLSRRAAWAVVVLLAAALVAVIAVAVHYHDQAASLQRQLSRAHGRAASASATPVAVSPFGLTVSSTAVALLGPGPLTGRVTFVAAHAPARQAEVAVMARISGGRPHTRYTLTGGSCSATTPRQREHLWAAGVTDAQGNADLSGPVSRVSMSDSYWLELSPGINNLRPALAGSFATASGITAYRSGPPMCG